MPASFVSLRPDESRIKRDDYPTSPASPARSFASLAIGASNNYNTGYTNSHANGHSNGYANGHSNGYTNGHSKNIGTAQYQRVNGYGNGHSTQQNGGTVEDEFLRLPAPQQDILLLHGPRQKYSLERAKEIPELRGDREILVQVLAIGLNPVDWKGADYGFSQPSYPWINGRDFAGIVVRAPRTRGRIQQGDVVFGASTDYRDIRKAAYQEYLVTTDYNVTRIPQGVSVKEGAALGVAYVAAIVSLGISFGVNFTFPRNGAPSGYDFLQIVRDLDPRNVPDDVREEIFSGITDAERPQPGEWIAIWGANSMTGQIALQLAKLAGLRVAAIADIAKGGSRLSDLGADFLVDKYDTKRAVSILESVSGGKLRFGFDANGGESASLLQEALSKQNTGLKSHLLGLAGLPKQTVSGVVHHKVPIKIFHEDQNVGEAISQWLEDLLISRSLKLPEVEIAEGGLAGINDALDRLRSGTIGGRRIVVPVGKESGANTPAATPSKDISNLNGVSHTADDLSYADSLNGDPNRVKFAYWVPNVSGGLVISKIEQRTHWDLKSNIKYARTAERNGFEYALSQIRFMAGYGADNQHEPVSFSQALLQGTERLKLIAALLPGPWNPAVAAKQIASIDHYSEGRIAVNIVSGWFKLEFTSIGQWWLDHAERYRRSKEFIQCLKGIWTQESFTFKGDFYQFHDYPLKPKPLVLPNRPYPEIFQGGNSDDAKENAGSVSDYYFMNGNTLEGFQKQIADVKERAKKHGREGQVKFALNGFVILRDTEEEAIRVLQEIQGKADPEAVEGFRQQVQNAGNSTANKDGMWANSKFEDLVQYNDGFKTKLIGTKEQIADRILLLKSLGVDIILTAFLHYEEEIEAFGQKVLPLVRKLEAEGRGRDEADEIRRTGDVYRARKSDASVPAPAPASTAPSPASAPSFAKLNPVRSVVASASTNTRSDSKPFATIQPVKATLTDEEREPVRGTNAGEGREKPKDGAISPFAGLNGSEPKVRSFASIASPASETQVAASVGPAASATEPLKPPKSAETSATKKPAPTQFRSFTSIGATPSKPEEGDSAKVTEQAEEPKATVPGNKQIAPVGSTASTPPPATALETKPEQRPTTPPRPTTAFGQGEIRALHPPSSSPQQRRSSERKRASSVKSNASDRKKKSGEDQKDVKRDSLLTNTTTSTTATEKEKEKYAEKERERKGGIWGAIKRHVSLRH